MRADALRARGNLALRRRELDRAQRDYESARSIYREHGDVGGRAAAELNLGVLASTRGLLEHAPAHYQKAIRLAVESVCCCCVPFSV